MNKTDVFEEPTKMSLLSTNYRFLLDVIEQFAAKDPSITILDYGCGRGEIVQAARSKKIQVFGADVFHGGPTVPTYLAKEGLLGNVIREIRDDKLQFLDKTFDLVISNQVFEHVKNLDKVLKEIRRVMKPNGVLYALFPPREIFREGHTGIPFLHRFPRNKSRYFYTLTLRRLGFGTDIKNSEISSQEWTNNKCVYIDTKTFYRPAKEIKSLFNKYFTWEHREDEIIRFRAENLNNFPGRLILSWMRIPGVKQMGMVLFTRLAGYLIVAHPKILADS